MINERLPSRREFTPSATIFRASISSPESVSSRMHSAGSRTAICRISLRFFSPPEKPTFTERVNRSSGIFSSLIFSSIRSWKSKRSSASRPRYLRTAFSAVCRKNWLLTPGISTGYWKAIKMPSPARSSGDISSRSLPLNSTEPLVTS